jgi:hypothetical protein
VVAVLLGKEHLVHVLVVNKVELVERQDQDKVEWEDQDKVAWEDLVVCLDLVACPEWEVNNQAECLAEAWVGKLVKQVLIWELQVNHHPLDKVKDHLNMGKHLDQVLVLLVKNVFLTRFLCTGGCWTRFMYGLDVEDGWKMLNGMMMYNYCINSWERKTKKTIEDI